MLKKIFVLIFLTALTTNWGRASIKKGSVISNQSNQTFFLNHKQKIAVHLTGSLRVQFINKWGVSKAEIPKAYKIVDFEQKLKRAKKKLKTNNKAKSSFKNKAKNLPMNL